VTTHRVILPVAPDPFFVLVAFVAGDVDEDLDTRGFADGLEDVDVPPTFVSKVSFGSP